MENKKYFLGNQLKYSCCLKKSKKNKKNILSVLKKVVLLHPFSARKHEYIETDEKIEIACVNPHIKVWGGHEDESIR